MRWLALALLIFAMPAGAEVKIGSKKFTESVILSEIIHQSLEAKSVPSKHINELGGTRILWNALLAGNVDVYPEYTSTIEAEILKKRFGTLPALRSFLATQGLGMSNSIGFNNTYALGMNKKRAAALGIRTISDLSHHPELKIGLSEEFLRREDGWPGLRRKYNLAKSRARALDHDVAYRALQSGDIDLMDLYSTDAEIQYYDLLILTDDQKYFPVYDAVYLYRLESTTKEPALRDTIESLQNKIGESAMITMNRRAKIEKIAPEQIAADFLNQTFATEARPQIASRWQRVSNRTQEHLYLVSVSLLLAILVGIPMGFVAVKNEFLGRFILWGVGGIQTVPSLALLVILIKPLNLIGLTGIGDTPALIALFLYSLLPIVRGAHAGFGQISRSLREATAVLGLSFWTRILRIELPLALPTILSGVKTAAVMNVGFATLGALVGAGGYGQPILTGIRLDDYALILEGALPSAILALVVQQFFDVIERFLVSPGLRK